jgi:anti-anti-sigma factor
VVVVAAGECRCVEAPLLEAALAHFADREPGFEVRLNLSLLTFLDSPALAALWRAKVLLDDAGCELVLVEPSTAVRRILEQAGLDQWVEVRDLRRRGFTGWPTRSRPGGSRARRRSSSPPSTASHRRTPTS